MRHIGAASKANLSLSGTVSQRLSFNVEILRAAAKPLIVNVHLEAVAYPRSLCGEGSRNNICLAYLYVYVRYVLAMHVHGKDIFKYKVRMETFFRLGWRSSRQWRGGELLDLHK